MKDSTKKLSKEFGLDNVEDTAHLYLYIKYIDHYLDKLAGPMGLVTKPPESEIPPDVEEVLELFTRKVALRSLSPETSTYHGKIVSLEDAQKLVMVEEDVELKGLEHIIPYKTAHDIVLKNPQNIVVFDCPCRSLQENPCEPIDVCMAVGDPMASFIEDHLGERARRVTAQEAAEIIRAEHERGHVHSAFFKDVVGGRFFAICNCCSCCCIAVKAFNRFKTPMLASSGYVAKVGEECTACGDCADACPFDAVTVDETAAVDEAVCMGCGVCEGVCAYDAIALEADPSRSGPLDIEKLIAEQNPT